VGADAVEITVTSTSEFRQATELVTVRFADFAFTKSPESDTVTAGGTASYAVAIRPVNGLAGTVTLSCSGAPRGATCRVEPSSITLDGTNVAQLKVRVTTSSGAGALPMFNLPSDWPRHTLPLLAALLVLLWMLVVGATRWVARGRGNASPLPVLCVGARRAVPFLAVTMLLMLLWASCGGGGTMSLGGAGTPAGLYSLTVTGTYSSTTGATPGTLAKSTSLDLRVN